MDQSEMRFVEDVVEIVVIVIDLRGRKLALVYYVLR